MATTIETLTTEQIRALMAEAGSAGDSKQVELCERALEGEAMAREHVVDAINSAEAMGD